MIGHRCRNCLWWDNEHPSVALIPQVPGKQEVGFCRRRRAGALRIDRHFYGVHPVMDADEFCGEFREDKRE